MEHCRLLDEFIERVISMRNAKCDVKRTNIEEKLRSIKPMCKSSNAPGHSLVKSICALNAIES